MQPSWFYSFATDRLPRSRGQWLRACFSRCCSAIINLWDQHIRGKHIHGPFKLIGFSLCRTVKTTGILEQVDILSISEWPLHFQFVHWKTYRYLLYFHLSYGFRARRFIDSYGQLSRMEKIRNRAMESKYIRKRIVVWIFPARMICDEVDKTCTFDFDLLNYLLIAPFGSIITSVRFLHFRHAKWSLYGCL